MAKLIAKGRIEAGEIVLNAGDPVDKLDKKEIERLKDLVAIGEADLESPAPLTEVSDASQIKVSASKKVEKVEGDD